LQGIGSAERAILRKEGDSSPIREADFTTDDKKESLRDVDKMNGEGGDS